MRMTGEMQRVLREQARLLRGHNPLWRRSHRRSEALISPA